MKQLLLITSLVFCTFYGFNQDSITVASFSLPNSHYKVRTEGQIDTYIRVHKENDPLKKIISINEHHDTTLNVQHNYTKSLLSDGSLAFVTVFDTMEIKDPNTGQYYENYDDLAIYARNNNNRMTIDSISSKSMNLLWKFRMKSGMQAFYEQAHQPLFKLAVGDTAKVFKSVPTPSNSPISAKMELTYYYILDEIREGVAYLSLKGFAELGEVNDEIEKFDITISGKLNYNIEFRNIDLLQITGKTVGKIVKGSEVGIVENTTSLNMESTYLGKNPQNF